MLLLKSYHFSKAIHLSVCPEVVIYVVTEVRHRGIGRYKQRGRPIQGPYIQLALYLKTTGFWYTRVTLFQINDIIPIHIGCLFEFYFENKNSGFELATIHTFIHNKSFIFYLILAYFDLLKFLSSLNILFFDVFNHFFKLS